MESLVIVSATDQGAGTPDALRRVASNCVPLVFASPHPAARVIAQQAELGVRHPFVCDGGAALYIPAGYFPELARIGSSIDGWHVVEFKPPYDSGRAVRLLISLYRLCANEVTIIGLADAWRDRALLQVVDVPIVVRGDDGEAEQLLASVPSAYVTTARGLAGWSEAVLGSLAD